MMQELSKVEENILQKLYCGRVSTEREKGRYMKVYFFFGNPFYSMEEYDIALERLKEEGCITIHHYELHKIDWLIEIERKGIDLVSSGPIFKKSNKFSTNGNVRTHYFFDLSTVEVFFTCLEEDTLKIERYMQDFNKKPKEEREKVLKEPDLLMSFLKEKHAEQYEGEKNGGEFKELSIRMCK